MNSVYQNIIEEAYEANLQIPLRNLAIYTWGNVSAFDKDKGVFAIKPSGVPYDKLTLEDIVVVDLDCNVVEGKLRPSSDTPTHAELYKAFSGIGGITHTHSTFATSWAQAGSCIPLFGTTHADHLPNKILCTKMITKEAVESAYEKETGKLIVETFLDYNKNETLNKKDDSSFGLNPVENPMVLVAGHGPFTWGSSASNSVYNAAVLEQVAQMAWVTLGINPTCSALPEYVINKHYERKHGKNSYYGQKKNL